MPKIVDHAARRDEIALVACRVVAQHGFGEATVVKIAREAGYTTGMIAHYFDSKQEIILAALRLILKRMEERLEARTGGAELGLLDLLAESLPLDEQRATECAFWIGFWGQVPADKRLKRINAWVHREYMRLYERCFASHWPEWGSWPPAVREQVLGAITTFINGLTPSAVLSPAEWPAGRLLGQLALQLTLWRAWAAEAARTGGGAGEARIARRPGRTRVPAG
ncbi:MAG TPA: TetR/AcrR family transcriptional regulator [Steroidobacteraceae bacterium]|nr:TetR/AcrR family transcriptional regulator [Steroidobacteraceae bacterium]